jgi:hypothetical protein
VTRPRLQMADPAPTPEMVSPPNFFSVEVSLFTVAVNMANASGVFETSLPSMLPVPSIIGARDEDELLEIAAL